MPVIETNRTVTKSKASAITEAIQAKIDAKREAVERQRQQKLLDKQNAEADRQHSLFLRQIREAERQQAIAERRLAEHQAFLERKREWEAERDAKYQSDICQLVADEHRDRNYIKRGYYTFAGKLSKDRTFMNLRNHFLIVRRLTTLVCTEEHDRRHIVADEISLFRKMRQSFVKERYDRFFREETAVRRGIEHQFFAVFIVREKCFRNRERQLANVVRKQKMRFANEIREFGICEFGERKRIFGRFCRSLQSVVIAYNRDLQNLLCHCIVDECKDRRVKMMDHRDGLREIFSNVISGMRVPVPMRPNCVGRKVHDPLESMRMTFETMYDRL